MNFYFVLLVMFRINSCVKNYNLHVVHSNNYSFQVSKDNLSCYTHDTRITCSVRYVLCYLNGSKKSKRSVFPKVWIPRSQIPLKRRLDPPAKYYTVQPYIINRYMGNKNHYHESLTTNKGVSRHSKNDLELYDNEETYKTTRRTASTEYMTVKDKNIIDIPQFFFDKFKQSFELFDSKFYQASFNKLIAISPANGSENGISFVQSGLFLYIGLMAISTEVDINTKSEIDSCLMYPSSVMEKIKLLKYIIDWLPLSDNNLKFQWVSRLVLEDGLQVSQGFVTGVAKFSNLYVEQFNSTHTKDNVFDILNNMVDNDTSGTMSDTFMEDDFSEGFCSIFVNSIYIRARWRVAPTVLNNTYPFNDGTESQKSVRMIKLNDMMGYTELIEWNAQAIEIKYASPGLTLLILLPRENSISNLITCMKTTTSQEISSKMNTIRVSATLPIYTLRMTLLLPEKLQMMNISRLVDAKLDNNSKCGELRLSHAVQRLMFWAEAGRNAFKDDGLEWDETPDVELIADRPYLFYVRWKNVTLMNGLEWDETPDVELIADRPYLFYVRWKNVTLMNGNFVL